MPIHARQYRFFCILKNNFMQSKQFREAIKRREWLEKKEEEGFCTLCIRFLPHEKTEECKFTKENFTLDEEWEKIK